MRSIRRDRCGWCPGAALAVCPGQRPMAPANFCFRFEGAPRPARTAADDAVVPLATALLAQACPDAEGRFACGCVSSATRGCRRFGKAVVWEQCVACVQAGSPQSHEETGALLDGQSGTS